MKYITIIMLLLASIAHSRQGGCRRFGNEFYQNQGWVFNPPVDFEPSKSGAGVDKNYCEDFCTSYTDFDCAAAYIKTSSDGYSYCVLRKKEDYYNPDNIEHFKQDSTFTELIRRCDCNYGTKYERTEGMYIDISSLLIHDEAFWRPSMAGYIDEDACKAYCTDKKLCVAAYFRKMNDVQKGYATCQLRYEEDVTNQRIYNTYRIKVSGYIEFRRLCE